MAGWSTILSEARERAEFPIEAYSEFMPPPYVGMKPYGGDDPGVREDGDDHGFWISEWEEAYELRPGLDFIASHLQDEIEKLLRGDRCQFSKRLLDGNPACPEAVRDRCRAAPRSGLVLALPLALSKTQDDKGRVRWTLFGTSHDGPAHAFWRSFETEAGTERPDAPAMFARFVAFGRGLGDVPSTAAVDALLGRTRILPLDPASAAGWPAEALPPFARALVLGGDAMLDGVDTLVTFRPFERLPEKIRAAWSAGTLALLPHPASLAFFSHTGYDRLSHDLPLARQVSLLTLFPRIGDPHGIRIPQSGWLDERPDERDHGAPPKHSVKPSIKRTHRWQRVERHDDDAAAVLDDPATVALFSTRPDDLNLYGKPMARNSQIWTQDFRALLDGPRATREQIATVAASLPAGGRFGYRLFYPPMRAGCRDLFWHLPLVARAEDGGGMRRSDELQGLVAAERPVRAPIRLVPKRRVRPVLEKTLEILGPGIGKCRPLATNVRKLVESRRLLGEPLLPSFADHLLRGSKTVTVEAWLRHLAESPEHPGLSDAIGPGIRSLLEPPAGPAPDPALTFDATRTRAFEERLWNTIAGLASGAFRVKNNADVPSANAGKTGGRYAPLLPEPDRGPELDALAEHLHAEHATTINRLGMTGRAYTADHVFPWRTAFDYGWWCGGEGERMERNVVVVIPGRNRDEAVIMADHYDTAYMEDVYDPRREGDGLRAAAEGADDNHSATATLLLAAEPLLELSRAGRLERDVWLVHLTGEEFPADCLGARALTSALVERRLEVRRRDGRTDDLSGTRVRGVFVLDMVAHQNDHEHDVFQISPGEGREAIRLALIAHRANARWNAGAAAWNVEDRAGLGRGRRVPDGAGPPPPARRPILRGEIRPRYATKSALYNTDGQIFSDAGIPVVLFMEDYDINRQGYHDTKDTMANIDLDYGAALSAIAIETVARAAASPSL